MQVQQQPNVGMTDTANPLRILFVATDLSTGGGVNRIIRDLAVLFRQRLSAKVTVANARSHSRSSYAYPADVLLDHKRASGLLGYLRTLWSLRKSDPDFVISSWTQDNILVTLAFLWSRTRVVLVEHASWNFHGPALRLLRRLAYPLAWRVIVLNPHDLAHYARHLSNVRMIPNPVMEAGNEDGAREKLVLAVGHLEPLKNFEDAVRTMAGAGLEDDGWSLAILGSGSREAAIRDLIAKFGLSRTQVQAPTDQLGTWYRRASVLLVTSRLESFSLVLAEAMMAGVVPLAYASDGPAFLLEDFPDLLIDVGDAEALADRLRELAYNNDLSSLRARLARSIEQRFSPDRVLQLWKNEVFNSGEQ